MDKKKMKNFASDIDEEAKGLRDSAVHAVDQNDDDILKISKRLIDKNREAYEKLAK